MENLTPAPGIVIVTLLKDSTSGLITTAAKTRLLHGKVVAVGLDLFTDFGAKLKAYDYCKKGDEIYFLSYEGDYDNAMIDNVKHYMVKFQDIRATK